LPLLALGLVSMQANAQFGAFERLVMPGPLAASHADVENECASCHVRFERQSQNQLCLACHEEIATDIAMPGGFHGRSADVQGADCKSCHTDHEGRDADIMGLDADTFDHDLTNFPLAGKHTEIECVDCHVENEPYHAAETTCYSCHAEDDRHRGNLGEACADCHSEASWTDVRFDHEETADYALTGAHADISCVSCHVEEQYENTPNTCIGCHREDDSHMGRNGTECQDCHITANWSDLLFDHFAQTGFALSGGHASLECASCHVDNIYEVELSDDCYSCHADDDSHDGINGTKCGDCHRVTEWPDVTFDHARDAEFALNGAHADLECMSCHMQPAELVQLETTCYGCHAEDDPHEMQLGTECQTCHNETAFDTDIRFDHDLTNFPLLGKHDDVSCDDCHETQAFLDAPEQCIDCHEEDDVHERRLGRDCALCHNSNDWELWIFDHDTQTDFVLDGAHEGLDCHSCHRDPVRADGKIELSTTCGSCHRRDDVHRGEFGDACEECHTTVSFTALRAL
jgi:hypothetical protein